MLAKVEPALGRAAAALRDVPRVVEALHAAGVPCLVAKGAYWLLRYGELSGLSDMDIFVDSRRYLAAQRCLRTRLGASCTELHHDQSMWRWPGGVPVDLHRDFFAFGRFPALATQLRRQMRPDLELLSGVPVWVLPELWHLTYALAKACLQPEAQARVAIGRVESLRRLGSIDAEELKQHAARFGVSEPLYLSSSPPAGAYLRQRVRELPALVGVKLRTQFRRRSGLPSELRIA